MKPTKKDLTFTESKRYYKFILNLLKEFYIKYPLMFNTDSIDNLENSYYEMFTSNGKFFITLEIKKNVLSLIEDYKFNKEKDIVFKICVYDVLKKDECILSLIGAINKDFKSVDELFELIKISHYTYKNSDKVFKRISPIDILEQLPKEKII